MANVEKGAAIEMDTPVKLPTRIKTMVARTKTGRFLIDAFKEVFLSTNMAATHGFILRHSALGNELEQVNEEENTTEGYWMSQFKGVVITLLVIANVIFRGISQVYLCNHPISGIFICIGLALSSTRLIVYTLVGTICSTIGSVILTLPETNYIVSGLCGYDGALTGCAVSVFITAAHTGGNESDDLISALNSKGLAIAAVLSVVSGVVHMACRNMNDLPALTLSFNICTLCFLLSLTDQQSDLTSLGWGPSDDDFLKDPSHWGSAQTIGWYHDAIVRGVGQFHFVHTTLGGWFVIIGIAISSRWAAATTVLGSFIGCITARYIMVVPDASLHMVRNGLYGYSSAGTCCAIAGGVFYHKNFYSLGFAIFGAGFTVLIKTAVDALLISDGLQLPSLTIPFVVTTWLIMLCKSAWLDSIAGEGEDMDDVRFVNLNNDTYGDVVKKLLEKNTNTSWKGHDAGQMQRRGSVEKLVLKRVDSIRSMIPSPSISRENSFSVFTPKGIGKAPSFGSGTPQGLGRVHSFSTPTGIGKSPSFTTPKAAPGSGRSAGQGVGTTPTRLGNAQGLGGSFDPARAQAMGVGTVPTRLGNAQGLGGSFDPARARAMGIGSSSSRRVYVEAFSPDSDSDDDQTPPAGTPAGAGASAGASSGARMGAGVGVSHGNGPGLSLSSDDDAGSESKRSVGGSSSAEWAATGRNAGRGSGRAYNSSDGNSSSNRDSEQNLYSSEGAAAADADAVSSMTADEHHPDRVIPFPDQTT